MVDVPDAWDPAEDDDGFWYIPPEAIDAYADSVFGIHPPAPSKPSQPPSVGATVGHYYVNYVCACRRCVECDSDVYQPSHPDDGVGWCEHGHRWPVPVGPFPGEHARDEIHHDGMALFDVDLEAASR